MKAQVYDIKHKESGSVELQDAVFGYAWKPVLVHQVVTSHLANLRTETAHAKTRGEVRGGGRKPWRQKGTGRARHGSRRSPIWVGGGVTFGPRNDRDFSKKINKKMKKGALYSALSQKLSDGEVLFVDSFGINSKKTKDAESFLRSFFGDKRPKSVLLVPENIHDDMFLATRNIQRLSVIRPEFLTAYDCASHEVVLFEQGAAEKI